MRFNAIIIIIYIILTITYVIEINNNTKLIKN